MRKMWMMKGGYILEHHNLDNHPLPKDAKPLYINEPWLIDSSLQWIQETGADPICVHLKASGKIQKGRNTFSFRISAKKPYPVKSII